MHSARRVTCSDQKETKGVQSKRGTEERILGGTHRTQTERRRKREGEGGGGAEGKPL